MILEKSFPGLALSRSFLGFRSTALSCAFDWLRDFLLFFRQRTIIVKQIVNMRGGVFVLVRGDRRR